MITLSEVSKDYIDANKASIGIVGNNARHSLQFMTRIKNVQISF